MKPTSDDKAERTRHLIIEAVRRITEAADSPDYVNIEYLYIGNYEAELTIRRKISTMGRMFSD